MSFLFKIFNFSFSSYFLLDFGMPKVLFLNFRFSFGIDIVQLTINLNT